VAGKEPSEDMAINPSSIWSVLRSLEIEGTTGAKAVVRNE
jgi:hypothetical protein